MSGANYQGQPVSASGYAVDNSHQTQPYPSGLNQLAPSVTSSPQHQQQQQHQPPPQPQQQQQHHQQHHEQHQQPQQQQQQQQQPQQQQQQQQQHQNYLQQQMQQLQQQQNQLNQPQPQQPHFDPAALQYLQQLFTQPNVKLLLSKFGSKLTAQQQIPPYNQPLPSPSFPTAFSSDVPITNINAPSVPKHHGNVDFTSMNDHLKLQQALNSTMQHITAAITELKDCRVEAAKDRQIFEIDMKQRFQKFRADMIQEVKLAISTDLDKFTDQVNGLNKYYDLGKSVVDIGFTKIDNVVNLVQQFLAEFAESRQQQQEQADIEQPSYP